MLAGQCAARGDEPEGSAAPPAVDEGGLRIGGILTDVLGASGRHIVEGLVRGDSVEALLEGLKGKARAKLDRLRYALQDGLDALTREMLDVQLCR